MTWQLSVLHHPDSVIVRASELRRLLDTLQAHKCNERVISEFLKIHTSAVDLRDFIAALRATSS